VATFLDSLSASDTVKMVAKGAVVAGALVALHLTMNLAFVALRAAQSDGG